MANRVTNEDIIRINESYYKNRTYAAAARETGFSASTVKKYVIPGWEPTEKKDIKHFDLSSIPEKLNFEIFREVEDYGSLCVLSESEKAEMEILWKEMSV